MAEKAEKSSKKSWFDGLKAEFIFQYGIDILVNISF